jgi:uncharacterized protein
VNVACCRIVPAFRKPAVVLVAALALCGCTERPRLAGSFDVPAGETGRVVKVSGTGRMSLPPSRVTFDCVVDVKGPTAEAAWSQGSARITKLSKALEAAGVRTGDLELSAIQLLQQSPQADDRPDAWWLQQRLSVTETELQRLPALLAVVMGAGTDYVSNARFGISDTRTAGDRARERALVEARTRAETLAQEVHLRLGAVRAMEEHVLSADSVDGAVGAPPGSFEVVTRIDVTYELLD